jgi:tetratricopeptide (TPR) repeat protein
MNPWVPGLYRVDIYINGSKVTTATFDVYNANCEGDLTFPGADRVDELRRNAEANGYSGDALYQFVVALHNRAGQCFLNGNLDAAYEDLSQAIQRHPKFDLAYYHRGLVLLELKRPKEALSDLDQAIKYYKTEDYYDGRGRAHFALENDTEALSDLDQAIQLNSKRADFYSDRGVIYHYLGEDQNALEDLKKAAQIYQDQDEKKYKKVSDQIEIIEGRSQGDVVMSDTGRQFTLAEMNSN